MFPMKRAGVSGPPVAPDDPRVRREITSYVDVSAAVRRLGLKRPMRIYDAILPDDEGSYPSGIAGTAYALADKHCVYVDLETLRDWAAKPPRSDPFLREQLPADAPWTFENLLRADIVHEMSHLRQSLEEIQANSTEMWLFGYGASSEEERARICGRELFRLVKITNLAMLST